MGLFGNRKYKKEIATLKKERTALKSANAAKSKRIRQLESLSEEKDYHFKKLMSDATRHGSSLGAKHMSDRKKYLKGK